jgi:hypothetical protein
MAAADDLEKKLREMTMPAFIAFGQQTKMLPTPDPQTGIDLPDEIDKEYQISRFLACQHNNHPHFERILKAAGIPSDAERAEKRSETQTKAIAELAKEAKRANTKSNKALIAWISLATVIIGLITALTKCGGGK